MAITYSQHSLNHQEFGLGGILGCMAPATLINEINRTSGLSTSYFSSDQDPLRSHFAHFMQVVSTPINNANAQFQALKMTVDKPNVFTPITNIEELQEVPPCMYVPILAFPPILDLFKDGRIEGYCFDPDTIPEDDPWGRLISNGQAELFTDAPWDKDNPNVLNFNYEFRSYDPPVSQDDLDALEITRKFLMTFLDDPKTAHLDPTCPTEIRG